MSDPHGQSGRHAPILALRLAIAAERALVQLERYQRQTVVEIRAEIDQLLQEVP